MKDILDIIKKSLQSAWMRKKLVMLVYVIQLMLALTIGLQVYQVIDASIGHSLSTEKIIDGYHHTILRDFINVHGASLSPLLGQLRWYIPAYLVTSVFIHGGILSVIVKQGNNWTDFWLGGATYFKSFLSISLFCLVLGVIWTFSTLGIFGMNLFNLMESFDRETPLLYIGSAVMILWLLGMAGLYLLSYYAKWFYIRESLPVKQCLFSSLRFTRRHDGQLAFILVLIMLVIALVYGINFAFERGLGIRSVPLIFLFIFIQQTLVFFRIYLRIATYHILHNFAAHKL